MFMFKRPHIVVLLLLFSLTPKYRLYSITYQNSTAIDTSYIISLILRKTKC